MGKLGHVVQSVARLSRLSQQRSYKASTLTTKWWLKVPVPRRQDAAAQAHPPASSFSWFWGICFWTKSASQFQVNWIRPPMRPASEPALSGVQIKPKILVHRFHKGLFLGARSRAATGASLGLVLASIGIDWHPFASIGIHWPGHSSRLQIKMSKPFRDWPKNSNVKDHEISMRINENRWESMRNDEKRWESGVRWVRWVRKLFGFHEQFKLNIWKESKDLACEGTSCALGRTALDRW